MLFRIYTKMRLESSMENVMRSRALWWPCDATLHQFANFTENEKQELFYALLGKGDVLMVPFDMRVTHTYWQSKFVLLFD